MATVTGTNRSEYFGNGTPPSGYTLTFAIDATGSNIITALGGNDIIAGEAANDTVLPGLGNDQINGGDGIDTVSYADIAAAVTVNLALTAFQDTGGAGRDRILNVERLIGTDFNDTLLGNSAANVITGGAGNDLIRTSTGNDRGLGGDGNDILEGGDGADVLFGEDGIDFVRGQRGNDGLDGGIGNDRLTGGKENDTLVGGAGADSFVFTQGCLEGSNAWVDVIVDFARGDSIFATTNADATILGYGNATVDGGLPAVRSGITLNDDPNVLDARIAVTTVVAGVSSTTNLWVLDVGNNSLTTSGELIVFA